MPDDASPVAAEAGDSRHKLFEAQLAATRAGDWQTCLRLIFALEIGRWRRRETAPRAAAPPA